MSLESSLGADRAGLICSARGCRADATTDLQWRNPGLHDAARVKHWLACDEHVDQLASFLDRRGFLLGRGPLPGGPIMWRSQGDDPATST